jgi:S1-C subfamily serine protease
MFRRTLFVTVFMWPVIALSQQTPLSAGNIFTLHRGAIIRVLVDGRFRGSGFMISDDGLAVTANHVVANMDKPNEWQYMANIKVLVVTTGKTYDAKPLFPMEPDFSNFDTALLQVQGTGFQHVTVGSWDETKEGDEMTLLPVLEGTPPLLLSGILSGKGPANLGGPKLTNIMIFQAPARKGFSGSPLFNNATGHVVGIVNTRLVGISNALDEARETLKTAQQGPYRQVTFGTDYGATILGLIDVFDDNLISGMGSAVAIDYAKAISERPRVAQTQQK